MRKKVFVKHNFGQNMINYDGGADDDDNNPPTLFLTLCPLNLLWSMYKSVIIPYSRSSLMMMRRQFSETNMWHVASWVMWDE